MLASSLHRHLLFNPYSLRKNIQGGDNCKGMCGIQDDKGRGQALLKSSKVPKLQRDLLYRSNLWYAISISKDSSFHRSAHSHLEVLCF